LYGAQRRAETRRNWKASGQTNNRATKVQVRKKVITACAIAVSCYLAPMVKNLVYSWQIVKVLQLQLQKHAKQWHLRVCGDS